MVFKLVAGVAADVYQLWSSADSLSEDNQDVLTVSSDFSGHYKNRLVQNWQMTNPKEVGKFLKSAGKLPRGTVKPPGTGWQEIWDEKRYVFAFLIGL